MSKTAQLLALADKATPGPWSYHVDDNFIESTSVMSRISDWPVTRSADVGVSQRHKNAAFIAAANPETIRQLVELVQQMVRMAKYYSSDSSTDGDVARNALEAFNKWEGE